MNNKTLAILLGMMFLVVACQKKKPKPDIFTGIKSISDCKQHPSYVQSLGFDLSRSGFSTSEQRVQGLAFVEFQTSDANQKRVWQHPTWQQFGYGGTMAIDGEGSVYLGTIPVINTLYNAPEKQNTLYKVDARTAVMKPIMDLPSAAKPSEQNPFGVFGVVYDCEVHRLYVASVAGSTRSREVGRVFSIDLASNKILDMIENVDVLGLGVANLSGRKTLFYGSARTSDIFQIDLDEQGKFVGKPTLTCSLVELGARGDDKARKIKFLANGAMQVAGVEFNFNLIAPTEKQETLYFFRYEPSEKKWLYAPELANQ